MKEGRKPEYPEKTPGNELQKMAPLSLGWMRSSGLYMALFGAPAGERKEGCDLCRQPSLPGTPASN